MKQAFPAGMVCFICGNPMPILRQHCRRKAEWMRGIPVKERVIWISDKYNVGPSVSGEENRQVEEEHAAIERELYKLGMQTTVSEDLEDLRLLLSEATGPSLLLAELSDPGGWGGWEVISAIRETGWRLITVFVISGNPSEEGLVSAFEAGGNEYMVKPLHIVEFRYRLHNILWLAGLRNGANNLLRIDDLILDPSRRYVEREGKELKMTPKEFDLLYYLAANIDEICPRNEILRKVWGYHFHVGTNIVDVYIRHLRMKVDKGYRNKLIHTVRGTGYVMRAPESAPHADFNPLS